MQISVDNTTTIITASEATSRNFSHTCGTLSKHHALYVCIALGKDGGSQPQNISATYAGVSMTKIGEKLDSTHGKVLAMFCLANPATGTNTVAISWTWEAIGYAYAISLYGVDVSNPYKNYTTYGPGYSPSAAPATIPGEYVLDVCSSESFSGSSQSWTVGSGQTQIMAGQAVGAFQRMGYAGSRELATGTSTSMTWTTVSGLYVIQGAIAIPFARDVSSPMISPALIS